MHKHFGAWMLGRPRPTLTLCPSAQPNQGKRKRATHSKVSSTFNMKIFKLEKKFCSTGQVTGHSSVVFKRLVNQFLNGERAPVKSIYAGNFHFFFTLFLQWNLGPPELYHWTATPALPILFSNGSSYWKDFFAPGHWSTYFQFPFAGIGPAFRSSMHISHLSKWLQTHFIWKCTILSVVKDQDVCSRTCFFTILATPEHCTLSRLLWGCSPLSWEQNEIYSLKLSYSLYKYRHYY